MKWISKLLIEKLPKFEKLLQLDLRMRKERVTVRPFPGAGADIDPKVKRPWKKIPNIREFSIKLMPYDWLFLLIGWEKRYSPTLELHAWQNGKANRYIDYMFRRITKEVELKLYDKAVKTIWILMNSTAYQVASYNHVNRNWHRNQQWWEVKRDLRKLKKLCKSKSTDLDYKRVYIPKDENNPDKGYRPLGVPKLEWRVYLHMYNNCITQWRLVTEGHYQHGYLPGRGVITAWARLFELVNRPNIYEADFKGFFDSIDLTGLTKILLEMGLPKEEAYFLENLNKSQVKLTEEDKIAEFKTRQFEHISQCLAEGRAPEGKYWEPIRRDVIDCFGTDDPRKSELLMTCLLEGAGLYWEVEDIIRNPGLVLLKYLEVQWALLSSFKETSFHSILKGVPQGAPTSCSLATLALRPIEDQMEKQLQPIEVPEDIRPHQRGERWMHKASWLSEKIKDYHNMMEALQRGELEKLAPSDRQQLLREEISQAELLEGLKQRCKVFEDHLKAVNANKSAIGDIILYADDVLFFPKTSKIDPVKVLELPEMGIKVNMDKSWWAKKDGEWLVEYVKFLGFKYYPPKKVPVNWEEWLTLWFWMGMPLDILLFQLPVMTLLLVWAAYKTKFERSKERFIASTRKGADLEFTDRESFISYLAQARELLLKDSSAQKYWAKKGLNKWLLTREAKWMELQNKVKHLFKTPVAGYIAARMQSNSWVISHEQDFQLRHKPGSWITERWPSYAWEWVQPRYTINVFIASSFACHDLMQWLRASKTNKKNKPRVRHVLTSARGTKTKNWNKPSWISKMSRLEKSRWLSGEE